MGASKSKSKVYAEGDEESKEGGGDGKPTRRKSMTGSPSNPDERDPCVISPKTKFMGRWDVFIIVLLFFTASVTPFEVAFLETNLNTVFGVTLYVINRFVDFGFIADMGINFTLGYLDEDKNQWVWKRKKIIRHYLCGW